MSGFGVLMARGPVADEPDPAPDSVIDTGLMGRRVPFWALVLTINLAIILIVAVAALARDAEKHGSLGAAALAIAEIPNTVGDWWKGPIPYAGKGYPRLAGGFQRNEAAGFVDPGYALITPYDPVRGRATVQLIRLSDGKLLKEWLPDVAAINARSRFTSLARIDGCGKPKWVVDGIFHHSLEQADDGTLWVPYRLARSAVPDVGPKFSDEALAQVGEDGRLIKLDRLIDIFQRSDLAAMWRNRPYGDDMFHLNDINPVRANGPYWQKGDLMLSLRNMSLLALYRPSSGKIVWTKIGPWSGQHDVSLLDDHRVMVFDNNIRWGVNGRHVDGNSRLLVYDLASGKVTSPLAETFARRKISTLNQGRATPLANGDIMVEETEGGRLMRLAPDGSVRWRYISADSSGRRLGLSWARYLDPGAPGILSAVRAATLKESCT
jgi:hypothetical protein